MRMREADPGTSLLIPLQLNNHKLLAVVDSAAQVTVVSQGIWKQMKRPQQVAETVLLQGAAKGSSMEAQVVKDTHLQIGGNKHLWTVYVAPIQDDMILGLDFLRAVGCTVDLARDSVNIRGEEIAGVIKRNPTGQEYQISQVFIKKKLVVPPNTEKRAMVRMAYPTDHAFVVEPGDTGGLLMASVVVHGAKYVPVVLRNQTDRHISLKKGRHIANAVELECILEDADEDEPPPSLRRVSVPGDADLAGPSRASFDPGGDASHESGSPDISSADAASPPSPQTSFDPGGSPKETGTPSADTTSPPLPRTGFDPGGAAPKDTDMPAHIQGLFERSTEHLNAEQSAQLASLLVEFQDVFARDDFDLGCFTAVKHKIDTGDAKPIKQRMRRVPLGFAHEEDGHLEKMLQCGVIEPSTSDWASPPVLVRKKDGSVRWCIDYRALNNVTQKDAFPLPLISECLDTLSGTEFLSTLDLASGYWQIEMDEADRHKTAFLTKHGLYQHTRMGFGLCNAPATFQRAIQLVLRGMNWREVLAYIDDVVVVGKSFEDHLRNLREVLTRFRLNNLKLKPRKCHLFQPEVTFLGKLVNRDGISLNPDNIAAVREWKVPTTVTEVEAFLGFVNYHREHIQGYAEMAAPLYQLTGSKGRQSTFSWSEEHQQAFDKLRDAMTSAPVLSFPAPEGQFILDTDASDRAVGAELLQIQDGVEKPIAYGSYVLTPAQRRYCTTRKELLAIIRFTRQFRHYLLGRRFVLRTDHSSLAWLMGFKNIEGQLARWLEELSSYDMVVQHRPGVKHADADGLSRIADDTPYCTCYEAGTKLESLPCGGCSYCTRAHSQWDRFIEDIDDIVPLAVRRVTLDEPAKSGPDADESAPTWLGGHSAEELRTCQLRDADLAPLIAWLEAAEDPQQQELALKSPATKAVWLCRSQLEIVDGVLYYRWEGESGENSRLRLVVPASLRPEVMSQCHDSPAAGHYSFRKTLEKLRHRYYWHNMRTDCELFTKTCAVCSVNKKPTVHPRAALGAYHVGAPMERVHVDILGPFTPPSAAGNQYVVMCVDQFTKWLECVALPDQTAATVAKAFVDGVISRLGCPLEVHTDQGRQFEGNLFQAVCELLRITKTRTTPYRPASNGQVERYNRTLLQLIRCARTGNLDTWDENLQILAGALRATLNRQTGFTPNMMMLGREVTQPVDVLMGTAAANTKGLGPASYVEQLRKTLGEAHAQARGTLHAAQAIQKRDYDLKLSVRSYEPGDLVYELNSAMKVGQCRKLQPVWRGPLLVTEVFSPVLFRVRGRRRERVVHHDRLKLCQDREIPLWMRRLRHTWMQKTPLAEPEVAAADTEVTEDHTEEAMTGLDGLAWLFKEDRPKKTGVRTAPAEDASTPEPEQDTPTVTRRGRTVTRPAHLRDYMT